MVDETEFEHALKNYLAIILGFADLLIEDLSPGDPHFEDVREIQKAAREAIALFNRNGESTT
jgi:hypothetical protein